MVGVCESRCTSLALLLAVVSHPVATANVVQSPVHRTPDQSPLGQVRLGPECLSLPDDFETSSAQ